MNIHRIRYRSGVINFPEIYTVEELLPLFSTRLALYEFPSVHIKIDMKGLNQKVESTITQVSIETKCNSDGARLQAVHIGRIRCIRPCQLPDTESLPHLPVNEYT